MEKYRNPFYNHFTYDQLTIFFFKLCSYLQNLVIFETILLHSILSFHTYDTRFRRWLLNLPNQRRGRFGCLTPFPREHHPSIFNLSCISFSLKGAGKSDCKNNGGILSAIWRKGLFLVMEAYSKLIGVYGEIRCLEPIFLRWLGLNTMLRWSPGTRYEKGVWNLRSCSLDLIQIAFWSAQMSIAFKMHFRQTWMKNVFVCLFWRAPEWLFSWNDFQETSWFYRKRLFKSLKKASYKNDLPQIFI